MPPVRTRVLTPIRPARSISTPPNLPSLSETQHLPNESFRRKTRHTLANTRKLTDWATQGLSEVDFYLESRGSSRHSRASRRSDVSNRGHHFRGYCLTPNRRHAMNKMNVHQNLQKKAGFPYRFLVLDVSFVLHHLHMPKCNLPPYS